LKTFGDGPEDRIFSYRIPEPSTFVIKDSDKIKQLGTIPGS